MAKLGIADRLADGSKDAGTLARETGTNVDSLGRVLRALAALGVLSMDDSKRFSLAPMGELLRSGPPSSFSAFARFQGQESYRAWGDLLHTVKTGQTAFDHVYGVNHFEYLAQNPSESATFNAAMALGARRSGTPFEGYDFGGHRVVVDVGGGRGTLTASVLRENSGMRGILFDLPSAVAEAPAYLASMGVADRCEIRTGSAFDGIPSGGDVYLMSRLLHDFPDEKSLIILRNCRKVLPPDGVLLLREAVLPDGPIPLNRALLDLEMMALNGGRERTETEWRALLAEAGFTLGRVRPGSQSQDLVEARPA